MPLSLDRRADVNLELPIEVLAGEIIDCLPPQLGLVPVDVVEGVFTVEDLPAPFDFPYFPLGEELASPSGQGECGFYPGVPKGLTDEQLTYYPGPAYFVIRGFCDVLGELLCPKQKPSLTRAIEPYHRGNIIIRRTL